MEAYKGEFLSIVGPSGSGKTSLLHCMSGLAKPTQGSVEILGSNPYQLSSSKISELRRTKIGFIFQSYNLVAALPAFENIVLPLRLAKKKVDKKKVYSLLEQLNFKASANSYVDSLSGGEQQKIAIARVLVSDCQIVFADEPTGALDSASGKMVYDLLKYLTERGVSVVMVTHDIEMASATDRALIMRDGQLVDTIIQPKDAQLFEALNGNKRR
ncbi:hypothetical protein RV11_GL003153 [Enterococcus phoeniculicola]|nr:hypothetical protein RV11_GL003153 [Enterococcus phoeniculicola]